MRTLILLLLVLSFNLALPGQKSIKCLFNDLKKDDRSFAVSLPGWLVRSGLNYASKHTEETDKALFESLKGAIKKVRVLVIESTDKDHSAAFQEFYEKAEKDKLELYASVKDGQNKVNIYVQEEKDKIKHFFLTVNGGKELALIHIKTDLPIKTFKETAFTFHKDKINDNE